MPKPVLQSLILADHIYEDKLTGKRIIAGVFNRIIRGVRVLKQMGPPVVPQQPPAFNPPAYSPPPYQPLPAPPAPQTPPIQTPQYPEIQAPAVQPAPAAPQSVPQPAAPQSQPQPAAPQPTQLPAQQPGYAAQTPAAPAQPPPAQPSFQDIYGQSSQMVQPGQPVQPSAPVPVPPAYNPPPPPQQPNPQPPAHIGPPGTPLQPGQRVLEIPPTGLQSGSPFAYLSLTEVRGPNAFVLELVNLLDESQLFRSDLRVDCPDPLLTVEMTVPLPPIAPPQAGIYALQLLHNNEILGSLRIIVEDAPQ